MRVVTVQQAKTNLSRLLVEVLRGEEIVIAKGKSPIARIVPIQSAKPRRPGSLKGKIALTAAFFDPLPAQEIAAWGEE